VGLIDRIAIIERGIDGTIVYLIKVSFLEKNEERGLELEADDRRAKLSPSLGIHFVMISLDIVLRQDKEKQRQSLPHPLV
jgi:hypothetical protein